MQWIRRIFAGLLCAAAALAAGAQVSQPGVVKEYNERAAKTPLGGVELWVRSASSTVSGSDGRFDLRFITLNAGDRVTLRSAEKSGYEIFNKEAVEQWNINPKTPFVLVMCRSDRFKRIRDNYERNSSANYRAQYSREMAAINKLRDEGKVKDEEYRRRLAEIQENYDRQLDNLDNYVDRFARIDLSELSAEEADIIELVQAGRFDEAIARYDSLDLSAKRRQCIEQVTKINTAIDRLSGARQQAVRTDEELLAAIGRQVDALMLAGGSDNNRRAAAIMMDNADLDTLNIDWQLRTGVHMQDYMADYVAALRYYGQALRSSLAINGEEHEQTAIAYNNIGTVYYNQGNFDKAMEYLNKALRIREMLFGKNHPSIALSYNDIGFLYYEEGNYEKALEYYAKSLTIREKVFGQEHCDVATSFNNIGSVYSAQGKYEKALEYFYKALSIRNKLLDFAHSDIAILYNNIGIVYHRQGNYDKALNCYSKALNINEKIYGLEHPTIATSYNNIGGVYSIRKINDKALEYFNLAMSINMKIYGKEHPTLAISYNNIGSIYSKNGDHNKALEYYNKALSIFKNRLGLKHPAVATFYCNIGGEYSDLENYDKALEYYDKAMIILKQLFSPEHPTIATLYNNIGFMYAQKGSNDKALNYFRESLRIRKILLGNEHPDVAFSYSNIGLVYLRQGNYDKALDYYSKGLMIREKVYGADSPAYKKVLANAYSHYIEAIQHDSKFEEAFMVFMSDKAVVAGFTDNASGLDGEYYLLEFGDWDMCGVSNVFDKCAEYEEKPIDIAVMKGDVISSHHFDNASGIEIGIKVVGKEERGRIETAYKKWKAAKP